VNDYPPTTRRRVENQTPEPHETSNSIRKGLMPSFIYTPTIENGLARQQLPCWRFVTSLMLTRTMPRQPRHDIATSCHFHLPYFVESRNSSPRNTRHSSYSAFAYYTKRIAELISRVRLKDVATTEGLISSLQHPPHPACTLRF
jgi:hypothetical protein